MRTMFCTGCRSLTIPGQDRCRVCGKILEDESESNQLCLTGYDSRINAPKIVFSENKDAPYMPYEPRASQLDIISDIRNALDEKRHIVLESGTGTGKTIVSLAAGLEHAKRTGKKVVYLTRTISQSDQVMKELKAISSIKPVSGITITGRNKSCPLFSNSEEYENLLPNVLSLMCEEKKSKSLRGSSGGCRYFDRTKLEMDSIEDYCRKNFPKSEEFDRYCEGLGACPYEVKKALMKNFDVIVAPYIHILSEDIRSNFIVNLGGEDVPILLIVDEAHNLIDAAREQESFAIPMSLIESAIDECTVMKKPEIHDNVSLDDFMKHLKLAVKHLAISNIPLGKNEFKLPPGALEDLMMSKFQLNRTSLNSAIEMIIELGESRMDATSDNGDHLISNIYSVGVALKNWMMSEDSRYIRSIKTREDGEYLSAACIDPSDIVKFMQSLDGAVHMSGTLQPLEQYYKIMCLPRTTLARTYPSPFPPENKSVLYVNDVTTKYDDMVKDPTLFDRMEKKIAKLCNAVDKNTLVFFPSYKMLRNMRPLLERDIDKKLYWEEAGQLRKTMKFLDIFRKGRGGVFFSVMGGSVAEGMDFPGDELSFAIIVGIQFPPPSLELLAMKDLFDSRYGPGMGWKYTSEVPALRKIRQAIGRLIRTETDRGVAVILDSRVSKYERQLDAKLSLDPVKDVMEFFSKEQNP